MREEEGYYRGQKEGTVGRERSEEVWISVSSRCHGVERLRVGFGRLSERHRASLRWPHPLLRMNQQYGELSYRLLLLLTIIPMMLGLSTLHI
ncbi:hypothetical protein M5K25_022129 [Dendrobium thyrsiflorum]|uniref:Uncharacterized protein n=1 Tax=Dendrobium thyrsiflorum TaxID=117978 RepID=A0ABD0U5K3_DENTH